VILSRKFGHGVKTDGFFAAYAVYLALVLVASALRVVVLPPFTRARAEGRLAGEVGTWLAALAIPVVPVLAVAIAWPSGPAHALAPHAASRAAAAQLLPWLVAAAAAQIVAGLLASALASLDDYAVAAAGFGTGAVAGIVVTIAFVGHGVVAFGWGLAVNGAIAAGVPLAAVLRRRAAGRPDASPVGRLRELVEGVALPFALQGLYVVGYRFAGGVGTGAATTFSYAYLIAATLVAVTASSIALVATVPFAREGSTPDRVARHVAAISWLSLALVAAAAGVFALAGEFVARRVLGSSYGGGTGAELGRLVVYLAPWMVVSIAVTVSYPLLFVRGRARWLPAAAVVALLVHVLLEWAGRGLFGLGGVAAGMAVTTALVLAAVLAALGALPATVLRLVPAAVVCGGVAAATFAAPAAVLGAVAAAAVGLVAYALVLGAWRPAGLRDAWLYLRALQ
jgi:O-antigen/teichoic acid export membrane protein